MATKSTMFARASLLSWLIDRFAVPSVTVLRESETPVRTLSITFVDRVKSTPLTFSWASVAVCTLEKLMASLLEVRLKDFSAPVSPINCIRYRSPATPVSIISAVTPRPASLIAVTAP